MRLIKKKNLEKIVQNSGYTILSNEGWRRKMKKIICGQGNSGIQLGEEDSELLTAVWTSSSE